MCGESGGGGGGGDDGSGGGGDTVLGNKEIENVSLLLL